MVCKDHLYGYSLNLTGLNTPHKDTIREIASAIMLQVPTYNGMASLTEAGYDLHMPMLVLLRTPRVHDHIKLDFWFHTSLM